MSAQEKGKLLGDVSLEEFEAAVRASLESSGLSEFFPREVVREHYSNPTLKNYHVMTIVRKVRSFAEAAKRKTAMEAQTGILLGGRDFVTRKTEGWQNIRSQRLLLLTEAPSQAPQLLEVSIWGSTIGDRGHEVEPKHTHRVAIRGEWNDVKFGDGTERRMFQGRYCDVMSNQPVPLSETISKLLPMAISPEDITSEDLYRTIVVRGSIRQFGPEAMFVEDPNKTTEVRDTEGNVMRDPETGMPIMRPVRRKEGDRDFVTYRLGTSGLPEDAFYEFNVLIESSPEVAKRLRVQFRNQRFGTPVLALLDGKQVFADAANMSGESREEDPFSHLTSIYQGTEVLAIGTLTQYNPQEERDVTWMNLAGYALIQIGEETETIDVSKAPVPALPTAAPAAPQVEGIILGPTAPSPALTTAPVAYHPVAYQPPTTAAQAQVSTKPTAKPIPQETTERLVEIWKLVQERGKIFPGMDADGLYQVGVFMTLPWFDIETHREIVRKMLNGEWKPPTVTGAMPKQATAQSAQVTVTSQAVLQAKEAEPPKLSKHLLIFIKTAKNPPVSFDEILKWATGYSEDQIEQALIDLLAAGLIYESSIHQYMAVK